MKLSHLTTSSKNRGGYLGQKCILLVDILGKCAFSWWISWANVHSLGGYLGQMCILLVDILGKCVFFLWISGANVYSLGGYLGQMCILLEDILSKCGSPCSKSWAMGNVRSLGGYLGQIYFNLVEAGLGKCGYLGQMCIPVVNSLDKCVLP